MTILDFLFDGPVYQPASPCKESTYSRYTRPHRVASPGPSRAILFMMVAWSFVLPSGPFSLWAADSPDTCREEPVQRRGKQALVRHLDKACTVAQREARAIRADEVLEALKKGRDVDLSGVVITGDLYLDALPMRTLDKILPLLSPDDRQTVEGLGTSAIRYVSGTVSIRDSDVRGRILNRTKDESLAIVGPVILSGTRFQEVIDLSRTIFLGVMDCSSTSFAKESYFVQARFQQPALFTQTVFGPHTRFHRSVFQGVANFYHARFSGLAELLEVSFEQGASFSGAQFLSGTGFSGSQFRGIADFGEAQFLGDVYFLFSRFDQEARFRGATFRMVADFSDAVFAGGQDLAQAGFTKPPQLPQSMRSEMPVPAATPSWMTQYGVTVGFLAMSLLLLIYLLTIK
jgi:uncharacterized protein YjbI with pentapeptide repeats